ncbi:hypothetical protein YC2023_083354 [Brassica napus]
MTLKEILYNNELFVRWIHCWETRNFQKPNLFMGIELLFIDSKEIDHLFTDRSIVEHVVDPKILCTMFFTNACDQTSPSSPNVIYCLRSDF